MSDALRSIVTQRRFLPSDANQPDTCGVITWIDIVFSLALKKKGKREGKGERGGEEEREKDLILTAGM